jgi:hypothetical protein
MTRSGTRPRPIFLGLETASRARGVPDRKSNHGVSGCLTVTRKHALTWAAGGETAVRRSLPSWS